MQEHDVRISVSNEFAEHFAAIKELRDSLSLTEDDPKVIVQVMTAFTSVLRDLGKAQQDLYNSETFARLQQRIINVLKEVDPELARRVLEGYEEDLRRLS
jgi:hypothetical protein